MHGLSLAPGAVRLLVRATGLVLLEEERVVQGCLHDVRVGLVLRGRLRAEQGRGPLSAAVDSFMCERMLVSMCLLSVPGYAAVDLVAPRVLFY